MYITIVYYYCILVLYITIVYYYCIFLLYIIIELYIRGLWINVCCYISTLKEMLVKCHT